MTTTIEKVSVHGGHSGQFCHHAKNTLEEVVQAYIAGGYRWAGITEHMPPLNDSVRYPDEADSNISAVALQEQFKRYFQEVRRLQRQYAGQIKLYCAFETETYHGSASFVRELIDATKPDYIVGSVHHVGGIGIDVNRELYEEAKAKAGSLEHLYCQYFDLQLAMMQELKPSVIGHFDLIRIFDDDYLATLELPAVWSRVERNLGYVAEQGFILDFNLRGFDKAIEQYPSLPVLKLALQLGVAVVPGDDSHGVNSVGRNYERGIDVLKSLGHDCQWQRPMLFEWR
ncbi:MAG TPA: histidinol-phosphatase [Candidatus Acidoferrum sp.]|nr:histidinol-phosphatase [Candidatus Acidoferrum sp.]